MKNLIDSVLESQIQGVATANSQCPTTVGVQNEPKIELVPQAENEEIFDDKRKEDSFIPRDKECGPMDQPGESPIAS